MAVLQRVLSAEVRVLGEVTGRTEGGLLILLGVAAGDTEKAARWLAGKCAHLRIFSDAEGKMNRSVLENGGGALVVSQFTLLGNTRHGRRPSFEGAAPPAVAERLYEDFCRLLGETGVPVSSGKFRAHMEVSLVNDGPVTLILDTAGSELS